MLLQIQKYLTRTSKTAPLAVFRVLWGLMLCASIIRFWHYGWIESLYLRPIYFFSYTGFEFVKPIGAYTYYVFVICGVSALLVSIGLFYRMAVTILFLSFTYIELMDKTTYLNHYYFVSLITFLMILLPANARFSVDAHIWKNKKLNEIPSYCIDAIKLMLGIVYFYAGLAKLNSDWLLRAQPLKIWLSTKSDLPIIGSIVHLEWFHYFMSWSGALYDLTIPFLLLWKKTRGLAFVAVVVFHLATKVLFPIGMFPYIMIVATLIFFSGEFHEKLIAKIQYLFKYSSEAIPSIKTVVSDFRQKIVVGILAVFFVFQLLFPFRHLAYPGELFWTEEGFRFSWRVMLMEKIGIATFSIVDPATDKKFIVRNGDFLTSFQQKHMATQPDFILQYAHILRDFYKKDGIEDPEVYVKSYVSLNGRLNRPYIDPDVNLAKVSTSFKHKNWILPFDEKIKGL